MGSSVRFKTQVNWLGNVDLLGLEIGNPDVNVVAVISVKLEGHRFKGQTEPTTVNMRAVGNVRRLFGLTPTEELQAQLFRLDLQVGLESIFEVVERKSERLWADF